MSFAEIILRIGAAIGGWLIFLGLCLTLAVIPEADCDPGSDELWRGTLLFGGLAGLGLCFVGRGLPWSQALRWFALPAGGLALYAGLAVLPAIGATTLAGEPLCAIARPTVDTLAGYEATGIERAWPVFQGAILLVGLLQAVRVWNVARHTPAER